MTRNLVVLAALFGAAFYITGILFPLLISTDKLPVSIIIIIFAFIFFLVSVSVSQLYFYIKRRVVVKSPKKRK